MKRIIALLPTFTIFFTIISSQDSYYYYCGRKMYLELNPDKASVLFPKGSLSEKIWKKHISENTSKSIPDNTYDIQIINLKKNYDEKKDIENLKSELYNKIDKNIIVLPAYKNSQFDELIMTNYLHIRLKSEKDTDKLHAIAKKYKLKIIRKSKIMPLWYTLSITPKTQETTLNVANSIFETGFFASSIADFNYDGRECISDPDFGKQWGLQNNIHTNIDISICSAWQQATGKGIKIAIVDNGIEKTHSDLAANIDSLSYDTETQVLSSSVYGDHGTHCAGIIAANINNSFIAGVAPKAKLMAVSNSFTGANYERNMAEGITWAWKNGADIISCSWRSNPSDYIKEAIDSLLLYGRDGKGAILVKSAGNQNGGPVTFPGNYRPEILTVSSIGVNGNLSYFSSVGNYVDVCAPGENIYSTLLNNTVGMKSGTSMACPHVSGLAALILEINPNLSGQEVRDIIEQNTKKIGNLIYHNNNPNRINGTWNDHYGYGLIDAHAAVQAACSSPVNFSNQTITTNTTVTSCSDINVHNVSVTNGAKLTLEAKGTTIIEGDFEVQSGSELEVK